MTEFNKLYDRYHESSQRFDYYLTGLAAAVLVYSVQSFDSGGYANYVWLAPIAWFFLVISVGAGLLRLERLIAVLGIGAKISAKENIYQNILQNIPNSLLDAEELQKICKGLPEELTPQGIEKWIKKSLDNCSRSIEYLNTQQSEAAKIAEWAYKLREGCLVIGLIILGILKTLNL